MHVLCKRDVCGVWTLNKNLEDEVVDTEQQWNNRLQYNPFCWKPIPQQIVKKLNL